MDQVVVDYLEQNKNSYSREVLIEELKKVGHSEINILEATNYVYGNGVNSQVSVVFNFWDFKTKIVYRNFSQKWKDLLFGFLAPYVLLGISFAIPVLGVILSLPLLVLEIFSLFYLWSRRRMLVFGLLTNFGLGICLSFLIRAIFMGGRFLMN